MNDIIGSEPLRCTFKNCSEIFENIELLKNHLQQKHNRNEFITSDDIVFMDLPWLEDQLIIGNALDSMRHVVPKGSTIRKSSTIDEEVIESGNLINTNVKFNNDNGNFGTDSTTTGNEFIETFEKPTDESCLEKCFSDDCCSCPLDEDCFCPRGDNEKCCEDCCAETSVECCSCDCDCCIM